MQKQETKNFDISDVLSIVNGALVSTRHMDGVYDILNFMTGESLFLSRAAEACKPALLHQFPQLQEVSEDAIDATNWKPWLKKCRVKFGDVFTVRPLSVGNYKALHPLAEPILKTIGASEDKR